MLFTLYYIFAVAVLVMHFTGFLARRRLDWLLFLVALTIFPAMLYL
ncbi:MAG: hypothetical protein KDG55_17830 [Rhodocyclaceae bacterium]|nr:hypothetical protein [Rhodocyclaceae bacterium]